MAEDQAGHDGVKESRSGKKLSMIGEKLFKPFRTDSPSPNPKNELRSSLDNRSDRTTTPKPQVHSGGRSSKGNPPSFPPPLHHQASREELIKQLDDATEAAHTNQEIPSGAVPTLSFESSPRKFSAGSTPIRVHSGSNPLAVSPAVSGLISPRMDAQAATVIQEMSAVSDVQSTSSIVASSPGRASAPFHQYSTSATVLHSSASGSAVPSTVFGEALRTSSSDNMPPPAKPSRHHRSHSSSTGRERKDEKKEKRTEEGSAATAAVASTSGQITLSRREELLLELADQFQKRLEMSLARLPLLPPCPSSTATASTGPQSPTAADRARALSMTNFGPQSAGAQPAAAAAAAAAASGSIDLLNRLVRIETSLTTIQKKISQYEQFFEHSFELQEHTNQRVVKLDSRVFWASCLMCILIAVLVVFIFR